MNENNEQDVFSSSYFDSMIIHNAPQFQIYFGDARDQMCPHEYLQWHDTTLLSRAPIVPVAEKLRLNNLLFLQQNHGIDGVIISHNNKNRMLPFWHTGDYLITKELHIGLGVLTADCLPVIAYDKYHMVVGIAHAGWRGAVAGVVTKMITTMHFWYKSQPEDLKLFFGPSAQRCCYQVDAAFHHNLAAYAFKNEVIQKSGMNYFFDLSLFVALQVKQLGITADALCQAYSACTMCNTRFHSHRRYQSRGIGCEGRQMTIVVLA